MLFSLARLFVSFHFPYGHAVSWGEYIKLGVTDNIGWCYLALPENHFRPSGFKPCFGACWHVAPILRQVLSRTEANRSPKSMIFFGNLIPKLVPIFKVSGIFFFDIDNGSLFSPFLLDSFFLYRIYLVDTHTPKITSILQ